jgi:hypothetical protein
LSKSPPVIYDASGTKKVSTSGSDDELWDGAGGGVGGRLRVRERIPEPKELRLRVCVRIGEEPSAPPLGASNNASTSPPMDPCSLSSASPKVFLRRLSIDARIDVDGPTDAR